MTALARGTVRPAGQSVVKQVRSLLRKVPLHVTVGIVMAIWLIPTLGLFVNSFRSLHDMRAEGWWTALFPPAGFTLESYKTILETPGFGDSFVNSFLITIPATILQVVISLFAGYAFAWLDFPGRDWAFIAVVALLVVPLQMALIPIFTLYNKVGIFDTVLSLILFHTAFGLPFAIFLLRNFFIGIPKELLEAARIDGASEIRIFLRLILPLGLPAIASLAIFQFLWTWNDLLVALTFGRQTQPITVAIFSQLRQFGSNIELIAPASFVSLVIPLAVFFAFQRYFVQGLLAGSVK